MPKRPHPIEPPDAAERRRALDPERSFLVQAPAGSGKTYLLTQRFLRLLGQAERPDEIVAITFTKAAAAEMRNRILDALKLADDEESGSGRGSIDDPTNDDSMSVSSLARKALAHARVMSWHLLDQPGLLRITTIDAFSRGIALQSPLSWGLLSGLGGQLEATEKPAELYRHAARRTLARISGGSPSQDAVEALLLWRDNNWNDVEALIVSMLAQRNRWHQEFVLAREVDWDTLRRKLEAPLCRACHQRLARLSQLLEHFPGGHDRLLELARSACETPGERSPLRLAERVELPAVLAQAAVLAVEELEDAVSAWQDMAAFLMTTEGRWRKTGGFNATLGFPRDTGGAALKARAADVLTALAEVEELEAAMSLFLKPAPTGYTDAEWEIVRHCFRVLREAAGELQVVFAEAGQVDFVEVSQIALRVLAPVEGYPSDFALRQADQIRHLLIDEFQDTNRNQHELLSRLVAAWPEREGRSCFLVGDPMQSIYGFRDAEVELFERLKSHGLDLAGDPEPFPFDFVTLRANFRTVPTLVESVNDHFRRIFPESSGIEDKTQDGVRFAAAEPVRASLSEARTELHLAFFRSPARSSQALANDGFPEVGPEEARQAQLDEMVALIRERLQAADAARAGSGSNPKNGKYRVAVLGRKRDTLLRVAEALHAAEIRFRAIDLVPLREQPEILDALAMARALLNPMDRRAWLGLLRAPWCGLSLAELHALASADDETIAASAVPALLAGRLEPLWQAGEISRAGYKAAERLAGVMREAHLRRPEATVLALGTWLASVWRALGGDATVNEEQQANLHLLWTALDKLPAGEADLLGPALEAALDGLFALPDPAASSEFGVQLMTIHKSKGLEFELVLVPELELHSRQGENKMISWLERGLEEGNPGSEPTEFLIAPIQSRGHEAGAAKKWVDAVKLERERSEMRRLLYVAATRAREELHLFARPCFRVNKAGLPVVDAPSNGALLGTAWPALRETIEAAFIDWLSKTGGAQTAETRESEPTLLPALAAEADGAPHNLIVMPAIWRPTRLRRLPEDFVAPPLLPGNRRTASAASGVDEASALRPIYDRTEGNLESRLEGTAIHAFLEELTVLRQTRSEAEAERLLPAALTRIAATLRARGLSQAQATAMAESALAVVNGVLADREGAWILAPHALAAVESRWSGLLPPSAASGTELRHLRPDRVFFAPPRGSDAPASWWIIDYKTSRDDTGSPRAAVSSVQNPGETAAVGRPSAFLEEHRRRHLRQLENYAQLLRRLRSGPIEIRAGIFYPRLLLFDHWLVGEDAANTLSATL